MKKITRHDGVIFVVPDDVPTQPEWGVHIVQENYNGSEVVDNRIAKAWGEADKLANSFDVNSKISCLALLSDPTTTVEKRAKIASVIAWQKSVWDHYSDVKQQILNGVDAKFDPSIPGNCPFNIWQIVA